MGKIRVSAVKYTNSIPFIYGLQTHAIQREILLTLDTPADCYRNLITGTADIGLVPVIIKNQIPGINQISNFGIGANGEVLSVILISKVPLNDIKTIILDYQSRTSVLLTRVLCRDFWKINPDFRPAYPGYENEDIMGNEALLVIGDRAFGFYKKNHLTITDLAGEWTKFTGLPFMFAFWASRIKMTIEFEVLFNEALLYGMEEKSRLAIEMNRLPEYSAINIESYLNKNIIHEISPAMREGMNLFLHLIRDFH